MAAMEWLVVTEVSDKYVRWDGKWAVLPGFTVGYIGLRRLFQIALVVFRVRKSGGKRTVSCTHGDKGWPSRAISIGAPGKSVPRPIP